MTLLTSKKNKKKGNKEKALESNMLKYLFFLMRISGGKLAEGRIQCWAWWVGVFWKRCLSGAFNENHWHWELIVLEHSYELWELWGRGCLGLYWWRVAGGQRRRPTAQAGAAFQQEIPPRLFQDQWRMRSRSQICELPADLLGTFVSNTCIE